MRYFVTIMTAFFAATHIYGQSPIGIQRWQLNDTTYSYQCGGAPANYLSGDKWLPINNNFHVDGDSAYCKTSIIKTTVKSNGRVRATFSWRDEDYTITQQLYRIIFFRKSDSTWMNIDPAKGETLAWDSPAVDSNMISWNNVFPGVDYGVEKNNGRLANPITFRPAFLDTVVALYNQRSDSADLYLASVHSISLSPMIDSHNVHIGNVPRRILKKIGSLIFQVGPQVLHFPGSDTFTNPVPVMQRWVLVGSNLYLVEFVKMSAIKQIHETYPAAPMRHNSEFTLDNDTDIIDNWLQEWSTGNHGAKTGSFCYVETDSTGIGNWIISFLNLNDSLGAGITISEAKLFFYVYVAPSVSEDFTVRGVWKNTWEEMTSTWDSFNGTNHWYTSGCQGLDDGASWNSSSGEGDATETIYGSGTHPTSAGWDSTEITGWISTCYNSNQDPAILFSKTIPNGHAFYTYSRENGSYNEYLRVTYTSGGGTDKSYIRRKRMAED